MSNKRSLKNELASTISGKYSEPSVETDVVTKITLIKILNWYSAHSNPDDLKSYLLMYAKRVGVKVTNISSPDYGTYGAIARSVLRGFTFEDDIIQRLDNFILSQQPKTNSQKVEVVKKVVAPKQTINNNLFLEDIDIGIDCAVIGKKHLNKHETQKSRINLCLQYINDQQETIDRDLKNGGMNKVSHKRITDYLSSLKKYYSTTKTTSVKKRPVNKATTAKKVQFSLEPKTYISKPIMPVDIIGKKKMYCYDSQKKAIICYVAILDGFTFSGTTLKNVDEAKSLQKPLRDESKLTQSISELNKLFGSIKYQGKAPTPRFSLNTVILATS